MILYGYSIKNRDILRVQTIFAYAIIDESTVDGISCDGGEKNFVGSEKKNSVYVNILYYIRSLISK